MVFFKLWDYLKHARYMHIWGPSGRHQIIWDFQYMGVVGETRAARQTYAKHGIALEMLQGWAGMLLHMGLLIHDRAPGKCMKNPGTPVMY